MQHTSIGFIGTSTRIRSISDGTAGLPTIRGLALATTIGERSEHFWLHTDYYRSRFGGDVGRLESFVEDARKVEPDADAAGSLLDRDVVSAVELAHGPGPGVNSMSERRFAAVLIARRHGVDEPSAMRDLKGNAAKAYVQRAESAVESNHDLRLLIERAESVLAVCARASRTSDIEAVPDTDSMSYRSCA